MRTAIISFVGGSLASLIAGVFTSGLAAGYVVVATTVWGAIAKVGGESLANNRWLLVPLTAAAHGLIFTGLVMLVYLFFPRLRRGELGGNLLLAGVVLYVVLLSVLFPLRF